MVRPPLFVRTLSILSLAPSAAVAAKLAATTAIGTTIGVVPAFAFVRLGRGVIGHRRAAIIGGGSASRRYLSTSLGFAETPPPPSGDDSEGGGEESNRWERLYEQGEQRREMAKKLFGESEDVDPSTVGRSEVRVVTFDLDNTLWRTGKVISAANDALAEFMESRGLVSPVRTEVVMGELFKKDRVRYCPHLEELESLEDAAGEESEGQVDNVGMSNINIQSGSHKPVLLTQLRKDAVQDILIRHNGYDQSNATDLAEEAFAVWTAARHGAIPDHMARSVLDVMGKIRSLRTSGGCPPVIGAITDGNSDPRTVPELGEYFDFVVNSEAVGVAKPDRRVYHAAIAELAAMDAAADLFDSVSSVRDEGLEDVIGPWWCHVGDDFIKDCVAAKELKMRTVWSRELVLPLEENEVAGGGDSLQSKKRNVADLVKELAEMKVVEMSIGAEDFVADSIHREFTDAILDRFEDLGDLLCRWHEEGLTAVATNKGTNVTSKMISAEDTKAIADVLEVIVPAEPPASRTEESSLNAEIPPVEDNTEKAAKLKADTKFCVYCGTKLPTVAKFCSHCGEKQPN